MHKNYYAQIQSKATPQEIANNQVPGQGQQPAQTGGTGHGGQANPFGGAQQRPTQSPFGGAQQQQPQQMGQQPVQQPYQQQPGQASPFGQQQPGQVGGQTPFQNQHMQQQPAQFGQQQPAQQQNMGMMGQTTGAPSEQYADMGIDYTLFNSDKSLLRCTTDRIPNTSAAFKDSQVPFGIIVKPYGDLPAGEDGTVPDVPLVSFKNEPIVRCKECRAYINPFVRWVDDGQRWICPFCGDINVTAKYYQSTIEADGYRSDHDERPELNAGTVDFLCVEEYMNRPPMPPTYCFAFDVSKPAVESGYLAYACSTLKSIIEQELLPGMASKRVNVCFLTYDENIQFYNLKPILKQPQMLVMTDPEEFFMPQPEDLLVNLDESYDLVMNLLDNMPNYFTKATSAESCFITALQCANTLIKSIGGKMVFFQVSHMILKHSKLQPPADKAAPKVGVERADLWQSTNNFFKNTGVELAHGQISFDLYDFSFGQKKLYKNLKTFADISAHSSGNLYHYPEFSPATSGLKFSNELYHNMSRKHAWEAVFRIRLSNGFTQTASYGNMQVKAKTADLVLCPTVDSDRVYVYEFEMGGADANKDQARLQRISKRFLFVQSALLYSTSEGERRIRCHSVAIPLSTSMQDAHEYLDINATSCLLLRKAIHRQIRMQNIESGKQLIEAQINNLARAYMRGQRAMRNDSGEFSENMQYLLIYTLGLLKAQLINVPTVMQPIDTLDRVVYQKFAAYMMSPEEVQPIMSPQIIKISDAALNDQEYPALESLQRQTLSSQHIYLCYNGFSIYMFVGRMSDPFFIYELFKVNELSHIDRNMGEDRMFENAAESAYLTALYNIINQIRYQRQPYCEIEVLFEGEVESEAIMQNMCVFDEASNMRYRVDYNKFMQRLQSATSDLTKK